MATVTFDKASRIYPGSTTPAVDALDLEIAGRRVPRPGRAVGLRQVHQPAHARRARGRRQGRDPHRRPRRHDAAAEGPRHRDGVPELRALPAHVGRREHGLRPQDRGRAARTRSPRASPRPPRSSTSSQYLDRKPKALSGGQRQRVAMGRAIVRNPQVFLMDEPLSNLDAKLRVQTRTQIASLQRRLGVTTVYVTHDQIEAMTMGDRVAVLKDGILQQCGTAARALRPPGQRLRRRLHRLARDEPAHRAADRGRRQDRRPARRREAAADARRRSSPPPAQAAPRTSPSASAPRTSRGERGGRLADRGRRRREPRRRRLRLRPRRRCSTVRRKDIIVRTDGRTPPMKGEHVCASGSSPTTSTRSTA